MTVKIAGHWELGWNTPIKEIELWGFPLRDFGVNPMTDFFMCPVTGIQGKVQERKTLDEILEENSDSTAIFCDERAQTTLSDFAHPENALYIFGRSNYSPFLALKREQDLSLKVETVREKGGLLWGHQAMSIILYDRMMKL